MKRRVLFAWETGTNYGHAAKIAALAKALNECEIIVAARDVAAVRRFCGDLPVTLLPAPLPPDLSHISAGWSYSHNLQKIGYCEPQVLEALYDAWQALFDLVSPDVVVAQSAPTTLLAAQGREVPVVHVGTGFDIPPASNPMPPFLHWNEGHKAEAEAGERAVLQTINLVLQAKGREQLTSVADALSASETILATGPETDHYPAAMRDRGHVEYAGALLSRSAGARLTWQREAPKIFAYLRPGNAAADTLFNVLAEFADRCDVILAAPGLPAEKADALCARGGRWVDGPVALDGLLDEATLCISHASFGVLCAALHAGVPQVVLPTQAEQAMLAYALANTGTGVAISPDMPAPAMRTLLEKALGQTPMRVAAERLRKHPRTKSPEEVAAAIARRIEAVACKR